MADRTIHSLLEEAAEKFGGAPALHQPRTGKDEGKYRVYSWIEYKRVAEEIAAGLRSLGVGRGDVVGLASETRAEFYLFDLGVMVNGSIAAAVYTSYPADNLVRTFRSCNARAIFVEDTKKLRALRAAAKPPLNVHWILLSGEADDVMTLDELRQMGRDAVAADPDLLARVRGEIRADDPAILYMTSGATGEPKMGLSTHSAVVANVDIGAAAVPMSPKDRTIAFLPSAHITQRLGGQFFPLRMGVPVWFSAGLSKLPHEMRAIRPTFFVAPPRVWERIYASICTEIRKRGGMTKKMFYGALGVGLEAWRRRQEGRRVPVWLQQAVKISDRLVFSKIRARFGGRMWLAVSGAAPLGKDLADFYGAIGMPLHEGYGLTEGGIVCLNPAGAPVSGSIGKAFPGVELKIADDGELRIKGPTLFAGYYNDPESTAQVLQEGWLATGDIAEIDEAGFVRITGRKKEVLVNSNGKKIYPARIENMFKLEPLINQVLLLGDKQPYVTALFTLNPSALDDEDVSMAEMAASPQIQEEMKALVARINQQLAPFEQIRRFKILERDFTIEDGELTPTMKVRRARVLENHKSIISELYMGREVD